MRSYAFRGAANEKRCLFQHVVIRDCRLTFKDVGDTAIRYGPDHWALLTSRLFWIRVDLHPHELEIASIDINRRLKIEITATRLILRFVGRHSTSG